MPNLVGLAFTSPGIAVMAIDRSRFRTHIYKNHPGKLHAFLQEDSSKLPVVFVKNVRDLSRVKDVEGIHSFLLFDDPKVMYQIKGANVLDADKDADYDGYCKVKIKIERLNAALLLKGNFDIEESLLKAKEVLATNIRFTDLMKATLASAELKDDFATNVCLHLVGAMTPKSWISRVQKVGLKAGIPVATMSELEKFIDSSPPGEMLWRAYYAHVEEDVSLEDACAQLDVPRVDIDLVINTLGTSKGLKYYRNPKDKPIVIKKKRGARKLLSKVKKTNTGSSILIPGLEASVLEKELISMEESNDGFDLEGVLYRIEKDTSSDDFGRSACAFLCGLTELSVFTEAKKTAKKAGASKEDLTSFSKYLESHEANLLWQAYCHIAYFRGVSIPDMVARYGVTATQLRLVISHKPMAYVCTWEAWPEDL